MRGLSFILGLMSVLAMLTLSASAAWAVPAEAMPCHEAPVIHAGMAMSPVSAEPTQTPSPASSKASMIMGCCAACVSTAPLPSLTTIGVSYPQPNQPGPDALPGGRSPPPEHGPPRRLG
jgi:hypothetical protein